MLFINHKLLVSRGIIMWDKNDRCTQTKLRTFIYETDGTKMDCDGGERSRQTDTIGDLGC